MALIFGLVLVLSLLTSKAGASLNHQELPLALIAAIHQDFLQDREGFQFYTSGHKVFFVDLNNDHVKEAILYPAGGRICSNRSCGIFIYTKVGNNYKKISADQTDRYSAVAGSRNEPSIGVLTTSNQGWRDLATRFFDYETRTEKWSRVSYRSHGYTDSPRILTSTPRTILEYSSVGSLKQIDKTQEMPPEKVRDRQLEKAIFRDNSEYAEVYPQLSSPASYSYNPVSSTYSEILISDARNQITGRLIEVYKDGYQGK
ncbi:MAG: hypothetical protein V7L11_18440 [Nostoc sp.]|uniref:hypothetical protein n=1 Tax=Nostoc sp. TaxID=1180 RepID=UPI002FF622F5